MSFENQPMIPDRVDFAAQPDHRDVIEVLNAFGHAHATVC
jgi:hypothetical protein